MRLRLVAGLAAGLAAAATAAAPVASAATAPSLASAIVTDSSVITGSVLVSDPSAGTSTLVSSTPVAGFPRGAGSYAILSTGHATDLFTANTSDGTTTSFGGVSRSAGGSDRDVTVLKVSVNVPASANCLLGFDFRFLSEEFPEYVGDSYSDAFIAEVDRTTWTSNGTTITAPDNFAFDANGDVVSINSSGVASMTAANADGTTFDGATDLLTAATPLTPGPHNLYFSIFDQGDNNYDSAVMIDNLRIGHVADVATQCKPGVTAAPTIVTPEPVTFQDVYGSADDTYTVPSTMGVTYQVGGVTVAAGPHPGSGTVTVTAVPDNGYSLSGTTSFTHTFDTTTATTQTSTGSGAQPQTVTLPLPPGGTPSLLDADGNPATTVTVPGEGTYTVDPATGVVTFDPEVGFTGTASGVGYQVTDSHGTTSSSTYTPSVSTPSAPVAADLTTSGALGALQTSDPVDVHDVSLLDAGGDPASTLTVDGQGTYAVTGSSSHHLTFQPSDCFTGTATPVSYRVDDGYGQSDTATYTPTVAVPAAPAAPSLTSSGTAPADQTATVAVPTCGTVTLLDGEGAPATSVTRAGEGSYHLDATTGVITFSPVTGYSGTPQALGVRVDDGFGHVVDGTYMPTVTAPALAAQPDLTSAGAGTAEQSATLPLPAGGGVQLVDGSGNLTTTVTVPHQGTYALDPATGVVTFVPVPGYTGTPDPVGYQVTDVYGQVANGTYQPSVATPAAPTAATLTSTGPYGAVQQKQVAVPVGGTAQLLDAAGDPASSVSVAGGTYTLDATTGVITFTPARGFVGAAAAVTYRLTDSYGQSSTATYRPTVTKAPAPTVGTPHLSAPTLVKSRTTVPVTCRLSTGRVSRCAVTAYAVVDHHRVVAGYASVTAGGSGRTSVVAPVRLNRLGRALAARVGGVVLHLTGATRQAGLPGTRYASATSAAVAPTVALRTVYFASDSATVSTADRAYLRSVRAHLTHVRSVTCTGFTDARSTVRYNASLAERRAQAVCAILLDGTHVSKHVVSRGETRPAESNRTSHGRALNRRTEVALTY